MSLLIDKYSELSTVNDQIIRLLTTKIEVDSALKVLTLQRQSLTEEIKVLKEKSEELENTESPTKTQQKKKLTDKSQINLTPTIANDKKIDS